MEIFLNIISNVSLKNLSFPHRLETVWWEKNLKAYQVLLQFFFVVGNIGRGTIYESGPLKKRCCVKTNLTTIFFNITVFNVIPSCYVIKR